MRGRIGRRDGIGRLAALAAGGALAAGRRPAWAQKPADTLRISWRDALPNPDPYYNPFRTGLVLAHHVWDCLLTRDPETFQLRPLLATEWRFPDPVTIDFRLRRGVVFHNGDPFTPDDVVYTVNTVIADPSVAVPSNYAFIDGATAVDAETVRIRLKRVFPAALEYLAMVLPIWPKAYRERVGAAAFARAPVGTGPYRITRIAGTEETQLERFESYFTGGAKGRPAIGRIAIRGVDDAIAEVADLLDGRADWIWNFPSESFDTISRASTLTAVRADTMRVGYLTMDAAGRSDPGGPMTKLKARMAVEAAIDRQTIAATLVQGGSRVPEAPCYPTQFGCDAAAAVRVPYDPARAKALLAEAGYPEGFSTEIVSYVLPSYGNAVQGYLKAVGIDAKLTQLPTNEAVERAMAGRDPIYMGSYGSYSINDVSAFLPYFFSGSGIDPARDPETTSLVEAGGSTADPDRRRALYAKGIRRITEQAYFLPLHTYVVTYGFSRALNFKPSPDELPRFYGASWR